MNPVRSFAPALINDQVAPPSVVLYKPRSGPAFQIGPTAATYTVFAFRGSTTMRPMCCVFSRPINFQVSPPFVDLKTPPPGSIVLRVFGSPVPAQTMFVSVGAIASTPIEMTDLSSNTGRQVTPLFVVFQMPPAAAATKTVFDGPGMPTTSESRPMKLAGPTVRHLKAATVDE